MFTHKTRDVTRHLVDARRTLDLFTRNTRQPLDF